MLSVFRNIWGHLLLMRQRLLLVLPGTGKMAHTHHHTVFYCVVGVAVKLVESENFTEANDCIWCSQASGVLVPKYCGLCTALPRLVLPWFSRSPPSLQSPALWSREVSDPCSGGWFTLYGALVMSTNIKALDLRFRIKDIFLFIFDSISPILSWSLLMNKFVDV